MSVTLTKLTDALTGDDYADALEHLETIGALSRPTDQYRWNRARGYSEYRAVREINRAFDMSGPFSHSAADRANYDALRTLAPWLTPANYWLELEDGAPLTRSLVDALEAIADGECLDDALEAEIELDDVERSWGDYGWRALERSVLESVEARTGDDDTDRAASDAVDAVIGRVDDWSDAEGSGVTYSTESDGTVTFDHSAAVDDLAAAALERVGGVA